MENKIGRPTKYSKDFPQKVEKYIQEKLEKDKLPTIEELSYRLGVNDDSVNEYSKKYPKFETCINGLKQVQSHMLQEKALLGEWKNTMAIFILKNNHKWTNKSDLKIHTTTANDLIALLRKEKDVL